MSLGAVLSNSLSGLAASQASMAIVSSNVANAQTPGYIRRSANQIETINTLGTGVRVTGVNRDLDTYIQTQLRTETSGAGYASQMANVLSQLQSAYGSPGQSGSLENAYNAFTTALQSLSASSGSASAQSAVLGAAQTLAQSLNSATQAVQALRSNAEQSLSASATTATTALSQIADFNSRLQGMSKDDPAAATLMDQRDNAISTLSNLMDIRVVAGDANQVAVYTGSGVPLVSGPVTAAVTFDNRGQLNANAQWSTDPATSGAGSLKLQYPGGNGIDITRDGVLSGKIAADLKLRDQTLMQAQGQLDQFAASLASSLSNRMAAGTAYTSGAQSGYDLDTSAVLPGNTLTINYTDSSNVKRQINVVRVDDPAALPLSNANSPPNTQTIGVNFSGGMASVVAQLNAALTGSGLTISNPAGSTLRALNTSAGSATVTAASTTVTDTSLASGNPQLAVFKDGVDFYTGKITSTGPQALGLAGRIAVNSAVLADPSKLTVYNVSPATQPGDTTRSDFLYTRLASGTQPYPASTGLGSNATPYTGTVSNYLQQFLTVQSNQANRASQMSEGQDIVVSTLQSKFGATAGVSIDAEMSNLITLQQTYAANAQVMSVVQQMMTTLLQAVR